MYIVTAHGQSSLILGLVSSIYLLCVIYVYPHLIITCNLLPNLALSTKMYNSLLILSQKNCLVKSPFKLF